VITAHGGEGELADASCPKEAPLAIGGGGSVDDGKGGALEISAPITKGVLSANGQKPTGWRVKSAAGKYTAYVICARVGGEEESESEAPEK
jgi:hypothetical protein